jgi:hypothetical protein
MKAGVGLVVRSNRTMGPDVGVVEEEPDEELQAAEIASSSEKQAKRMTAV